MIADKLLQHLQKVKQTGPGRWLACCPAHDDKLPSLAIREVDDRLLIYCFAGCSVSDVVSAVGLDLSDLFPKPIPIDGNRSIKRPFSAMDALRCISFESTIVLTAASDLANGMGLTDKDYDRLILAVSRVRGALEVVT